jgi:toxin-antitoxin system, toxin component, bro domain protein
MNEISIFSYEGSSISFSNGESVMVNATEMAKSFGKTTKDWLRTNASSEFINSLSAVRQICPSQLVVVRKGNSNEFEQGTWMHEDVALEFARWLSPAFAIWCNDRIKELLTQGVATVNDDDATILHAMQVLQKRVEEKQHALECANERIALQDTQLREQAPKVSGYDNYISSAGTFTTTQIAKEYGWGAETLNRKLKERGIQYKQNGQWLLTTKYDGRGYTRSIPRTYTRSDGTTGTQMQTVWTVRGREFIHSIFKAA